MKIVVATDGHLSPSDVVPFVAPLAGDGPVQILTVVEIPRRLLADLRQVYGERSGPLVESDAEYVGIAPGEPGVTLDFPGDDAIIDQYLANQKQERTSAMAGGFADAGVEATVEILDGENAASLILRYLADNRVDLIVLGARGRGLFEGMLGSVGTKVARHSPCPVLLIR